MSQKLIQQTINNEIMQEYSLTDRIKKFEYKIGNKKGHRFLYGSFDRIVDELKNVSVLPKETINAIDSCIVTLIGEANLYQLYPLWAIRCNLCATRLVEFVPDKKKN